MDFFGGGGGGWELFGEFWIVSAWLVKGNYLKL